jgi:hypothetical protein
MYPSAPFFCGFFRHRQNKGLIGLSEYCKVLQFMRIAAPCTEIGANVAKAVAKSKRPPARRPWSKDDLRVLKGMAREVPVAKIAKALKRTTGATRHKATITGISLSMKPKKRAVAKKR